jgi:transposase-like protein
MSDTVRCDNCGETGIPQFYLYMTRRANGYCLCKRCCMKERKRMHDSDCSCMICWSGRKYVVPTPSPEQIKANRQADRELKQQQIEKWTCQHEQMSALLSEHPDISASELGRRVGCSHETARKWKRRFRQRNEAQALACKIIGIVQCALDGAGNTKQLQLYILTLALDEIEELCLEQLQDKVVENQTQDMCANILTRCN